MGVLGDGVLVLIQAVVFVYDIVTFPLYTAAQRPWSVRESHSKQRSQTLQEDDNSVTIKANYKMTKPLQVTFIHCVSFKRFLRALFVLSSVKSIISRLFLLNLFMEINLLRIRD